VRRFDCTLAKCATRGAPAATFPCLLEICLWSATAKKFKKKIIKLLALLLMLRLMYPINIEHNVTSFFTLFWGIQLPEEKDFRMCISSITINHLLTKKNINDCILDQDLTLFVRPPFCMYCLLNILFIVWYAIL